MHKQPEATEKTRRAFVDAFCKLYSEKPIEVITVNEVTRIAGYNRSTFYQYFRDIYELMDYLENFLLDTLKNAMAEKKRTATFDMPFDDMFIHVLINIFEENSLYFSALFGKNANISHTETVRNEMKQTLCTAMDASGENKYLLYLLEFYSSAFVSMITCWYRNGKNISSAELGGLILNIVKLGVLPVMTEYGINPAMQSI